MKKDRQMLKSRQKAIDCPKNHPPVPPRAWRNLLDHCLLRKVALRVAMQLGDLRLDTKLSVSKTVNEIPIQRTVQIGDT